MYRMMYKIFQYIEPFRLGPLVWQTRQTDLW